jgi:hypothetical protein
VRKIAMKMNVSRSLLLVRDDRLFVSDPVNQRVVSIKFEPAVSAECAIP